MSLPTKTHNSTNRTIWKNLTTVPECKVIILTNSHTFKVKIQNTKNTNRMIWMSLTMVQDIPILTRMLQIKVWETNNQAHPHTLHHLLKLVIHHRRSKAHLLLQLRQQQLLTMTLRIRLVVVPLLQAVRLIILLWTAMKQVKIWLEAV